MQEGYKNPEWRRGVLNAWHQAGRPDEISNENAHIMMRQALEHGFGGQALEVHDRVPNFLKIDSIHDMLNEYRRSMLPPIHTFQLRVDPTSDRGWKKAYDDYVRAGYPTEDANAFVRQRREEYMALPETQRQQATGQVRPPMPPLPESEMPDVPPMPDDDDAPMTDAQYQRRLALLRRTS